MLISMLKWFRGYLYLEICGYGTERFLNLCKNHNILIWNLYRERKNCFVFCMSVCNFRKLLPIIYKTKAHVRIRRRCGFPFILYQYRKRKILLLCGTLFITLLYVLSGYLWDIQISGQSHHTEAEMVKYLSGRGIELGTRLDKIDCMRLEEEIRERFKDIGWVSAERKGTRLLLRLHETVMPSFIEETDNYCHRIAAHDGVIHSIVTAKGVAQVKKGDTVKRGDILIKGIVEVKDDADTVVKKIPVVADGTIELDTKVPYEEVLPKEYQKKEYTGKEATRVSISIGKQKFFFSNPLKKIESLEKYDIMTKESIVKLTRNLYLPIRTQRSVAKQYRYQNAVYKPIEARTILTRHFNEYLQEMKDKGILILSHSVKVFHEAKQSRATGEIFIREPQTLYQRIQEEEWRVIEQNESSGEES